MFKIYITEVLYNLDFKLPQSVLNMENMYMNMKICMYSGASVLLYGHYDNFS